MTDSNNGEKMEEPATNPRVMQSLMIGYASLLVAGIAIYAIYDPELSKMPELDDKYWWGESTVKEDLAIKEFEIEFSDVAIEDLRQRLLHTRPLVNPLNGAGFKYGFNTQFFKQVLDYWQRKYDYEARETYLNQFPQYMTNIQGLNIHYIHAKPKDVKESTTIWPILLIHSWPGSVREFYDIIPKLTSMRSDSNIQFEVIVPSLPGFGFSEAPKIMGMGTAEVAVILNNLMSRLGHKQYFVHGGDWGYKIGSDMATLYPNNILGFHAATPAFDVLEAGESLNWLEKFWPQFWSEEKSNITEMGHTMKPDTIGIALSDSPAGLAAYILEQFAINTNPENVRAQDGALLHKYSLTTLLDNVVIYWFTNSITTAMRLYAESHYSVASKALELFPTPVPTWGIFFRNSRISPAKAKPYLGRKFSQYVFSTMVEDGGHYGTFEMSNVVADDIFKAVSVFLKSHKEKNRPPTIDKQETIYDFTVKDASGNDVSLEIYKGYVVIIVNVASKCGLTDTNYKQLNQLHEKYAEKGLKILAFPCNQFANQEPGDISEITQFVNKYDIKFDLFNKIDVNGPNTSPLWAFLKRKQTGSLGDFVKWNFSKFIIDRNGLPVERFAPYDEPLSMEALINKYL